MSYKICEKKKNRTKLVRQKKKKKKKKRSRTGNPPSPASPVISNGPPLSEMAKFDTRGLFPWRKEDPRRRIILAPYVVLFVFHENGCTCP